MFFTTEEVEPQRRLREWNDRISQVITAVDIDGKKNLAGRLKSLHLGSVTLSSIEGDATRIQNSTDGYRRNKMNDYCGFIYHESQDALYNIKGKEILVREGNFIFLDFSTKFHCNVENDDKKIILARMPSVEFFKMGPNVGEQFGKIGSASNGAGAILKSFLQSCLINCSDSNGARLGSLAAELMQIILSEYNQDENEWDIKSSVRERALQIIEENLTNPDLDTNYIAKSLGVSDRYVQLMFSDVMKTPSAYIRDRRLEWAASQISRNPFSSISEIAFDSGFNDLSHFNRTFKARFGITPSYCRRRYMS